MDHVSSSSGALTSSSSDTTTVDICLTRRQCEQMERHDSVNDDMSEATTTATATATAATSTPGKEGSQQQQLRASAFVGRRFWRYFPDNDLCLRALVASVEKSRFIITYSTDDDKAASNSSAKSKSTFKDVSVSP